MGAEDGGKFNPVFQSGHAAAPRPRCRVVSVFLEIIEHLAPRTCPHLRAATLLPGQGSRNCCLRLWRKNKGITFSYFHIRSHASNK